MDIDLKRINDSVPSILTFLDVEGEDSVCLDTISEFIDVFNDASAELYVCYDQTDELQGYIIAELIDALEQNGDINAYINIIGCKQDEEAYIIRKMDYYVTNRSKNTEARSDIANEYGVKILSGVTVPIFSNEFVSQIK